MSVKCRYPELEDYIFSTHPIPTTTTRSTFARKHCSWLELPVSFVSFLLLMLKIRTQVHRIASTVSTRFHTHKVARLHTYRYLWVCVWENAQLLCLLPFIAWLPSYVNTDTSPHTLAPPCIHRHPSSAATTTLLALRLSYFSQFKRHLSL